MHCVSISTSLPLLLIFFQEMATIFVIIVFNVGVTKFGLIRCGDFVQLKLPIECEVAVDTLVKGKVSHSSVGIFLGEQVRSKDNPFLPMMSLEVRHVSDNGRLHNYVYY